MYDMRSIRSSGQIIDVNRYFGMNGRLNLQIIRCWIWIQPDTAPDNIVINPNNGGRIDFYRKHVYRAASKNIVRFHDAYATLVLTPRNHHGFPLLLERNRTGHIPGVPAVRMRILNRVCGLSVCQHELGALDHGLRRPPCLDVERAWAARATSACRRHGDRVISRSRKGYDSYSTIGIHGSSRNIPAIVQVCVARNLERHLIARTNILRPGNIPGHRYARFDVYLAEITIRSAVEKFIPGDSSVGQADVAQVSDPRPRCSTVDRLVHRTFFQEGISLVNGNKLQSADGRWKPAKHGCPRYATISCLQQQSVLTSHVARRGAHECYRIEKFARPGPRIHVRPGSAAIRRLQHFAQKVDRIAHLCRCEGYFHQLVKRLIVDHGPGCPAVRGPV